MAFCKIFICKHSGFNQCCIGCERFSKCEDKCLNHPDRCNCGASEKKNNFDSLSRAYGNKNMKEQSNGK
jgi:hypothetical protein